MPIAQTVRLPVAGPSLTVVVACEPPLGESSDLPHPAKARAVAVIAALPITSRRRMLWVIICVSSLGYC